MKYLICLGYFDFILVECFFFNNHKYCWILLDSISKCFEKNSKKRDLKNESERTEEPKKLREVSLSNLLMITIVLVTVRIYNLVAEKTRRQSERDF